MSQMTKIASLLRRLRADERGIALPVAMMATVLGLTFAGVVILASVNAQSGDSRDQGSNSALAAADAAANLAILRQKQARPTEGMLCVTAAGAATALPPDEEWCEEVEVEDPPAGTQASYTVRPIYAPIPEGSGEATNSIEVIATGSTMAGSREVTRRIKVEASAGLSVEEREEIELEKEEEAAEEEEIEREKEEEVVEREEEEQEIIEEEEEEGEGGDSTFNPFNYGQITGIESLYLRGNSKVYRGGAGSNGKVEIIDSSRVCGGLRYGPGTLPPVGREDQVKWVSPASEKPFSNGTGGGVCSGEHPTTGTVDYPSVALPAGIATSNSNARLSSADPVGDNIWQRGNIAWNAANRDLSINYGWLRMEGTLPYFLCKFTLTGGATLKPVKGRPLRIFFDDPKNCPGLNGAAQMTINGGTTVESDEASGPGFYPLGSSSNPKSSKVYFGNGAASGHLVIYAPNSAVEVIGGINLNGAILGRTLKLEGGANVNQGADYTPPPAGEFTEVPPSGPDPVVIEEREIKQTEREERQEERETKQTEREERQEERETRRREREERSGSFQRGAYVECSARASGASPQSGC